MTGFQTGVVALLRSALMGTAAQLPDDFDYEKMLKLGKKHQILPLLSHGLQNSGLSVPDEVQAKLRTAALKSFMHDQMQRQCAGEIFAAFEENGIDFMPLKGILHKQDYPRPELRSMSDLDVLIRPEQRDSITSVMQQLGHTEGYESDHELLWESKMLLVELHKRLIPSYNRDYFAYFGDGWQLAKPLDGHPHRFAMTDADALIYEVTHMAKHYRDGGIGIRHLTDVYLCFRKTAEADQAYIQKELQSLRLWEFFGNVLQTGRVWFEGEASTEKTDLMTTYIMSSGAFGSNSRKLISTAVRKASEEHMTNTGEVRYKRMLQLAFPPCAQMCSHYPVLKKVPVLLPAMWVVRGVRGVFCKQEFLRQRTEEFKAATAENMDEFRQSLSCVGLDFNFEE